MEFLIFGVLLQVSIIDLVFQTGGGGCVAPFVMISIKNKEGGLGGEGGGPTSPQYPLPPIIFKLYN